MGTLNVFDLYKEMHDAGIKMFYWPLDGHAAATIRHEGRYAVFVDTEQFETTADELCSVAHEYAHCETGTTHAICSPLDLVARHEYRANKRAVHRLIPIDDLHEALQNGYREIWELAEHFGVTEDFVRLTADIYRRQMLL